MAFPGLQDLSRAARLLGGRQRAKVFRPTCPPSLMTGAQVAAPPPKKLDFTCCQTSRATGQRSSVRWSMCQRLAAKPWTARSCTQRAGGGSSAFEGKPEFTALQAGKLSWPSGSLLEGSWDLVIRPQGTEQRHRPVETPGESLGEEAGREWTCRNRSRRIPKDATIRNSSRLDMLATMATFEGLRRAGSASAPRPDSELQLREPETTLMANRSSSRGVSARLGRLLSCSHQECALHSLRDMCQSWEEEPQQFLDAIEAAIFASDIKTASRNYRSSDG
eukprot:s136_g4.t1